MNDGLIKALTGVRHDAHHGVLRQEPSRDFYERLVCCCDSPLLDDTLVVEEAGRKRVDVLRIAHQLEGSAGIPPEQVNKESL